MSLGRFLTIRFRLYMLAGVVLASIFFAITLFSNETVSGQNVYSPTTPVMQQMITSTNKLREQSGLQPLVASMALEASAKAKLTDMNNKNYWSHYDPDGVSFSSFIWKEKEDASLVGENLARCFVDYSAAFTGLVNSPKHYAVLTGDFTYIGVASEITASGCESIVMHVSN